MAVLRRSALEYCVGGVQMIRGLLRLRKFGVRMERGVRIRGGGTISLGRGSVIRRNAYIFVGENASLIVGERSNIGAFARINVVDRIELGDGVRMSWDCQMMDTDFHDVVLEGRDSASRTSSIAIGDHVLIGARTMILKGTSVGSGSVIGAGSVVVGGKAFAEHSLVGGNPAKCVAKVARWNP